MEWAVKVWELVQAGGPPVIVLLLLALYWLNEDRKTIRIERDKYAAQKDELTERVVKIAGDSATSVREMRELLFRSVDHPRGHR